MINPIELRIGNIVRIDGSELEVEVNGRMIAQFEEGSINLLPVELDVETLLRCGFVVNSERERAFTLFLTYVKSLERIDFWIDSILGRVELCRGDTCYKTIPCWYLHQIQNIVFALVGKELEIDLLK